jgi:TolB protein
MNLRVILPLLMVTSAAGVLHADKINLQLFASRFDSIPIGVVEFKVRGKAEPLADQPWKIIANDFDLCGRFHVVKKAAFDSAAFAAEGVGIYVDGEYSVVGGSLTFTCFVNDVAAREHLYKKEYKGDVASVRRLAHVFSNELYELLYGDKGMFESRVLYVRSESGEKNVAIMDYDGGNARQITKGAVLNLFPVFADSATMLWTSFLKGKPDIYKGSVYDAKNKVFVASRGIQVSPAVSPVDGTVAYASSKDGSLDIYTCALDGSGTKQLTFGGGVETAPCWSPNGYQIAYTSDRAGNPQIFVMDADGSNQRRLTHKSRYCDSPVWSPAGDRIAFTSMADDGKLDIWIISPDGSNEMQLTSGPGHHEYPAWSRGGLLIGFISRSGTRSDFCIMKSDGSRVRQITTSGDVQMPDWENYK